MTIRAVGLLAALSLALLAGACSTPSVPANFTFVPTSPRGLVAFGMTAQVGGTVVNVARIDPATCRLINSFGIGDRSYEYAGLFTRPGERVFKIDDFEPGYYVIRSISTTVANFTQVVALDAGSFAFRVEPGRFIYIGDFMLPRGSAAFAGYDEAGLGQHLARFPGIAVQPLRTEMIRTSFSAEREGGRVPGCALQP